MRVLFHRGGPGRWVFLPEPGAGEGKGLLARWLRWLSARQGEPAQGEPPLRRALQRLVTGQDPAAPLLLRLAMLPAGEGLVLTEGRQGPAGNEDCLGPAKEASAAAAEATAAAEPTAAAAPSAAEATAAAEPTAAAEATAAAELSAAEATAAARHARRMLRVLLQRSLARHLRGLALNLLLLPFTVLLTLVPGPNLFLLWNAYRLVEHALALRGARRGLRALKEPRRLAPG